MIYADTTSTQAVPSPTGRGTYLNAFLIGSAVDDTAPLTSDTVSNLPDGQHFAPGSVFMQTATRKVYLKASPDDTAEAWTYVGKLEDDK